ncbi:MAG: hypothetical protein ACPLRN_02630 [Microgenomates group bacterium]
MIKKIFAYLIIFSLLIIINILLTIKAYSFFSKQAQIESILADISQSKENFSKFSLSNNNHLNKDNIIQAEVGLTDGRVANLKAFFRKHNSPLYDYAQKIVEVSDKYGFDYRLLPAIAMQESNLCRVIPENSYNCWGWGIYGNLVTKFKSYDEAIETVAKGLKEEYIDKGLVTASSIMKKYTPPSTGSWAHGVNTFLKALE